MTNAESDLAVDRRTLRILHVEDNALDGELLADSLRKAGVVCDIVRVATGDDFTQHLAGGPFDLIISDYTLPNYSGMAALEAARDHAPETPFVFFSGTIGEERAVESLVNGASDYVLKQNPKRLVAAIRRVIREANERAGRARAESALRETAHRLQSLIDSAPAVIFAKDKGGRYILANRRLAEHRMASADQIIGRTDEQIFQPEEAATLRANDATVWATGEPFAGEIVIRERDGPHTYLSQKFLLRNLQGEAYAVCGIATDVTHTKRLESQLNKAQRMEAVGRLAGGIAHDFNNLLGIIMASAELAVGAMAPGDASHQPLEEILETSERAAALTKQLLTFSRGQVMAPKVVDLNEIVHDTARLLGRLIGEDIKLVVKTDDQPILIHADRSHIEQVVLNLAINARDAMPTGGSLTVATATVTLDDDDALTRPSMTPGPYVQLSVEDTGIGMDAETQAHAFEPFFTTKSEGKGTGLGLATVYGIVTQHGGSIWVYSEPGLGTVFKIYLPLAQGAVEAEAPRLKVRPKEGGKETILIVEDNTQLRAVTVRVLQVAGYTVLEAGQGSEAIQVSARHRGPIDLLMTDVVLPHISGPDLVASLRRVRPDMRIVFMSGYAGDSIGRYGPLPRGAHFLQKPFRAGALKEKVREALDAPPIEFPRRSDDA